MKGKDADLHGRIARGEFRPLDTTPHNLFAFAAQGLNSCLLSGTEIAKWNTTFAAEERDHALRAMTEPPACPECAASCVEICLQHRLQMKLFP
jgi:hypothetical protein